MGSRARASIRCSPRSRSSHRSASCSRPRPRSPCASRRARSSGSAAPRAASSRSRPPGASSGTFVAAFWLVPELGTDQVLAVAAVTLLVAAAGYALAERLLPVALALIVAAVAAGGVVTTLSPQESGRIQSSARAQLVAALPRARAAQPRQAEPRPGRRRGVGLRRARGARHALPPHVRARRRRGALPPLRQHVPERDGARRPVRDRLPVHRLPAARPRLRAVDAPRALHRPRRRLGREAHVARLPVAPAGRGRDRPRGRARRRALVRAAAGLAAPRGHGRGRPPLPADAATSAGT